MSDKKFKRKTVYRLGVPETNSSSSHSCCINFDATSEAKPGDKEYDLIIKDGILYIPEPSIEFGNNTFKTNSCLIKLQYVCGLYSTGEYYSGSSQKNLFKLKRMLMKFFKVRDVKFEWVEEAFLYGQNPADNGLVGVSIDHQSVYDMYSEICESPETIWAFITNKSSWLYIAPDSGVSIKGFYKEMYIESEGDFVLRIEFGKNIGRVDIVSNNIEDVFVPPSDDIRRYLIYNRTRDIFFVDDRWFFSQNRETYGDDELFEVSELAGTCLIKEGDKYYIGFEKSVKIEEKIIREEIKDNVSSSLWTIRPMYLEEIYRAYPGIEIIKFPVSLESAEFGKLF